MERGMQALSEIENVVTSDKSYDTSSVVLQVVLVVSLLCVTGFLMYFTKLCLAAIEQDGNASGSETGGDDRLIGPFMILSGVSLTQISYTQEGAWSYIGCVTGSPRMCYDWYAFLGYVWLQTCCFWGSLKHQTQGRGLYRIYRYNVHCELAGVHWIYYYQNPRRGSFLAVAAPDFTSNTHLIFCVDHTEDSLKEDPVLEEATSKAAHLRNS